MTTIPVRIVVADDHTLVRAGITGVLAATPGVEVAGEAATGAEAIQLVAAIDPDLVAVRGAACVGGDRGGRVHRTAVAQALGWVQHDRSGVTRA